LTIAIPITIGASIVPVMDTIDAAIVMRRLQAIGYSVKETTGLYGQLKGIAQNFINLPQVLSVALGISLIPAISDAFARKNYDGIRKITRSGVRITLFIGFPAALGLYILANPILDLFYSDAETVRSASVLLQISAFSVIFLTLVQSLTAILQGLGKQIIPVRNLAIGALVKVILTYVLTGIKGIGIMGAAFSTVVAFFIAAVLNFLAVKKHTKTEFKFSIVFMKPFISSVIMTVVVWFAYNYASPLIGSKLATIVAVLIGAIVYILTLLITGAVTDRDFTLIPGGNKIASILKKLRLLRN